MAFRVSGGPFSCPQRFARWGLFHVLAPSWGRDQHTPIVGRRRAHVGSSSVEEQREKNRWAQVRFLPTGLVVFTPGQLG